MTSVSLRQWVQGARPQTLQLGIAPILLAVAAISIIEPLWYAHWLILSLCLLTAIFLQIGVNFANDYSDGIRGTDANRVGPLRLVGSGLVAPHIVRNAAVLFLGLAAITGISVIAMNGEWWLVSIGILSLAAAWFYTGGRRPYGYMPLGEVMVLLFFGLVPVGGTMYVTIGTVTQEGWLLGLASGLFAAAVLLTNNLRDREKDALHNKRTLSVRIGSRATRAIYALCMVAPFALALPFLASFPAVFGVYLLFVALTIPAILQLYAATTPFALVSVLKRTLLISLIYAAYITLCLLLA